MSSSGSEAKGAESIRRRSSLWIRRLFRRTEDDDDPTETPEWYYATYVQPGLERRDTISSERKSRASQSWKKFNSKKKTSDSENKPRIEILSALNIHTKHCERQDVESALLANQFCDTELSKVNIELGPEFPIKTDAEIASKWICPRWRSTKVNTQTTLAETIQKIMKRVNSRAKKAMDLLLEKMDKGELPKSWEQMCQTNFQHGVDITPTPSKCGKSPSDASSQTDTEKSRSFYKTKKMLSDQIMNYLEQSEGGNTKGNATEEDEDEEFCQVLDLYIQSYLQEPKVAFLLKKVGILDDNGCVLCTHTDFYELEHIVKTELVEMAKTCVKNYMGKGSVPTTHQDENDEVSPTPASKGRGSNESFERRAKLFQVLQEELAECCPDLVAKKARKSRRTRIYRDSVPLEIPRRGLSILQEKYAKDVAGKILSTLQRGSLFEDDDEDFVEIMPFQHHESFETDNGDSFNPLNRPRKSEWIQLDEPVNSEFNTYKIPPTSLNRTNDDINCREDYKKPRDDHEKKNIEALRELAEKKNLNKKEKVLYLQLKYFRNWLETVRKHINIRSYSPNEEPETLPLWRGPYPKGVVDRIRCLKGMRKFTPTSPKIFYKAVRKLEKTMFEQSRQILDNMAKEDDTDTGNALEEPIVNKESEINAAQIEPIEHETDETPLNVEEAEEALEFESLDDLGMKSSPEPEQETLYSDDI